VMLCSGQLCRVGLAPPIKSTNEERISFSFYEAFLVCSANQRLNVVIPE